MFRTREAAPVLMLKAFLWADLLQFLLLQLGLLLPLMYGDGIFHLLHKITLPY